MDTADLPGGAAHDAGLLAHALDTAPDAFVSIDADGVVTGWNRSSEELFGWPAGEAVGRPVTEVLVPPHLREQHSAGVRRAVLTGESPLAGRRLGLTGLHRDGTEVPLEVTIWPSEGSDGPRFHAHLRDVRPDADFRRRLLDSTRQLQQVADAVPGVVYTFVLAEDGTGRFPFVSSACEELYGFTAEEAMADPELMHDAIHPDDREGFRKAGWHSGSALEPMLWSGRIVRPDGSTRWVTVSSRPTLLETGETRWHGVVADRTPERTAQQLLAHQAMTLEEEQAMLAATLRNLSDAVVACDADGRLTLFNAAAERLHGRAASPIFPEEWPTSYDLVDPGTGALLAPEDTPLIRALHGEEVVDVRVDVTPAGLPRRQVVCTGQQLLAPDGRLLGAVVSMRDVTELLAAHEGLTARFAELQRADQLKSDLMGMLGHEISTPLTNILGYAEAAGAMLGEPGQHDRVRRSLQAVERGARRLDALRREILALVALDAGRLVASPQTVAVLPHLQGAALLAGHAERIVVDCDPALTCSVQPSHLEQVLANLVGNADKYAGGARRLGARAVDDGVEIIVGDAGPGVADEFRHRLFQRFSRADATAREVSGTGLGLFIVRELVTVNGGRVEHRDGPDGGSDFVVVLPRATG